jgi:hypothetical protein
MEVLYQLSYVGAAPDPSRSRIALSVFPRWLGQPSCPLRGDERCAWDVDRDAARVAREQRTARYGGMRTDQEVWEDGLARSSRATVVGMSMAREERCSGRYLLDDRHRRQHRAQCLDARESWGDLGTDDGVEDDRASLGCLR